MAHTKTKKVTLTLKKPRPAAANRRTRLSTTSTHGNDLALDPRLQDETLRSSSEAVNEVLAGSSAPPETTAISGSSGNIPSTVDLGLEGMAEMRGKTLELVLALSNEVQQPLWNKNGCKI
jgi:hypothetical protein